MAVASIIRDKSIAGHIDDNQLEPSALKWYHDELVAEARRRGYPCGTDHKTPVTDTDMLQVWAHLPPRHWRFRIDTEANRAELLRRCPECRARYEAMQEEQAAE
jgi:hypothetical protein